MQDILLSRWVLFVAASLIVFLGLLPGLAKDAELFRGLQSADRNTDTPHLIKREPLRALAAADRKDSAATHIADADGAILPGLAETNYPAGRSVAASQRVASPFVASFWPGSLPRAPPTVS
ncbi:hypothetical protein E2F50_07555 [Rhizobium deserti]|uniref:Uncharacterized protein n=1 Tax=Rhizobium deserti TaxID=2547961 RepID=A0A4R5UIV4_9HYPH|nr:hypothetical protein [Rhizobium deserti]TDK36768.1 hypothetical protein E2F50_07555 [Rhizobium deserti]